MIVTRTAFLVLWVMALAIVPAHAGPRNGAVCDIQSGPCRAATGSGMEVLFSILPRPVRAMEDLEFVVTLTRKGAAVPGAVILLELSMPEMFMGTNQPKLREDRGGTYRGRGIIPRCVTGQRTWNAFIAVRHDGIIDKLSFHFEVQ